MYKVLIQGLNMKKVLISVMATIALAGCSYDYYTGNVKYVQNGRHCEYSFEEVGNDRRSSEINGLNTVHKKVYSNTRCEDLFTDDNGGKIPTYTRRVLKKADAPKVAPVVTATPAADATPVVNSTSAADVAPVVAEKPAVVAPRPVVMPRV